MLSQVPLGAHDMWIEPTTFAPLPGQIVGVRLRVGQDLLGDPLSLDPALVNQFVMEDGDGQKPVVRRAGADPAGLVRVARAGPARHRLPQQPERARDVGGKVQSISEGRRARGGRGAARPSPRNRAPRPASCLRAAPRAWCGRDHRPRRRSDRAIGFTLELVAERNPYALRPGQDLPVRLTYENRPLAGALVVAINQLNPAEKLTARSDTDGRVAISAAAGRHVADQSGPHGPGARRRQRRVGQLLGVIDVSNRELGAGGWGSGKSPAPSRPPVSSPQSVQPRAPSPQPFPPGPV